MISNNIRSHPAYLLVPLCAILAGCAAGDATGESDPPVPVAEAPLAAVEQAPGRPPGTDEPRETTISGFRVTVPSGWRQVELSDFQRGFVDARFEVPAAGDDVEITLTTSGGGVQANIERWISQFTLPEGSEPRIEMLTVDGVPVTLVDLHGTYQGMRGPSQHDYRVLGAAFDGRPRQFFIKLTGPAAVVTGIADEFRAFVRSARRS